ncbi:hypothetical protein [Caloramator australicus]|uniref:Uncharacterized protein n=1 Tax=Caloramator australicus RC3 TaxID=857293 RepID=I7LHT7_9CLOT|nr:hypothetical protein [Caloramator australicus]CCJ34301.1 hypothetical protein CAAU_2217 [Caloramator australicus RC3]
MFKLTSDRIDYSSILSAPFGYRLDFCVGTTYSLELDALIGTSISLGLSEDIDGYIKDNPIYMFEALSKTADKTAVFCQGGQIKAPFKSNTLYILLEKMVAEINMKNNKSFHPKTWFIKYTNDKDSIYRFIVLSRNLTFDNSWDVAVCLEGRIQDKTIKEKNKPIRDFLLSLINLENGGLNISKKEK